ncbi:hypothetical protein FRC14_007280 [Serendipita sp. 396]|nr:hypothetical protein FRC14_007280 [Serendipita sp. 396]
MPGPGNSKQRKKQKEKKKKEAKRKAQQAASAIQNPAPEPHVDAPETPLETVPERPTQDSKVVNKPEEYVLYHGEYYEKIPEDELALYEGQEAEVVAPQYGVEDEDEGEGTMAVYDDEGEALWYNRTRSTHRVCPTCQRVYNVGDTLRAHVQGIDEPSVDTEQGHQQRLSEQYLSGICSVTCFALATYNFGHAAVLAYSLSWRQLGPATQKVLEGHGSGVEDQGLSYYVRLSRCSGKELSELIGV